MSAIRLASALIGAVLLVSPCLAKQLPKTDPTPREIMSRVDELSGRVQQVEWRLRQLEKLLLAEPVHVDERGIIRDPTGRPIGVWGIDPTIELPSANR